MKNILSDHSICPMSVGQLLAWPWLLALVFYSETNVILIYDILIICILLTYIKYSGKQGEWKVCGEYNQVDIKILGSSRRT